MNRQAVLWYMTVRHLPVYCTFTSVFTAEPCSLYRALPFLRRQPRQCHLICTDSLSALQNPSSYSRDHPIFNQILIQLSHLQKSGKSVVFCSVPCFARNLTSEGAVVSVNRTFLHSAVLSSWKYKWTSTQATSCDF
jgi:hypothetical protein